jgi:hypothetical protein
MRANPTEVDESRIKHVLKAISQYDQLAFRHQCCFVHGMGGQKRNFFADLARETGSALVWSGSILPRWIGSSALQFPQRQDCSG